MDEKGSQFQLFFDNCKSYWDRKYSNEPDEKLHRLKCLCKMGNVIFINTKNNETEHTEIMTTIYNFINILKDEDITVEEIATHLNNEYHESNMMFVKYQGELLFKFNTDRTTFQIMNFALLNKILH